MTDARPQDSTFGPVLIERRFRRRMRQELKESRQPKPLALAVTAVLAALFAYASGGTFTALVQHWVGWFLLGIALLYGAKLGAAQLRRHAQPYDHTLVIGEEGIQLVDNMRQQQRRYPWPAVRRVSITPEAFEIGFRESTNAEAYASQQTYLVAREKLSKREDKFLGERLIEL